MLTPLDQPFDVGNIVVCSALFTVNSSGAPIDPGDVTIRIRSPNGTINSFDNSTGVVRDSVGAYHYNLLISEYGVYSYRFEGTSPAVAAGDSYFQVAASPTLPC